MKHKPSKSSYIPRSKRTRAGKAARFREQVLRDWLGCDEPYDLNDGVTSADALMEGILEKMGLSQGINEEELRSSWGKVAGDFIGQHTKPESLRDGILRLHVLQPAMRFHLEQSKAPLLKRLQEELGADTIRDVRFILG